MSRSGAGKDQAGREFEALLAALPRKRPVAPLRAVPRTGRAPVGDSEFENLLNEFRSLSNPSVPVSTVKAPSVSPSQPLDSVQPAFLGQEGLVQALNLLGRERDRLRARLDTIHDESALKAIDGLNRQITHLQVSVMRDLPDKFLLLRAGGQHFALILNEVVCVHWRGEVECDSKKGVRHGTGWVPVHAVSPRQGAASTIPEEDVVAIIACAGNVRAVGVDSVEGVVSATLAPLNTVLQGAQGLKGVAVTETGLHALVLDANRLGQGS